MKIFSFFKHWDCGKEEKICRFLNTLPVEKRQIGKTVIGKKLSSDFLEKRKILISQLGIQLLLELKGRSKYLSFTRGIGGPRHRHGEHPDD